MDFIVAFGLQVSAVCKRTNSLLGWFGWFDLWTHAKLEEKDTSLIKSRPKNQGGSMNNMVENPQDFDDALLTRQLNGFVASDKGVHNDKLLIQEQR